MSVFGVFDGHSGSRASNFIAANLSDYLDRCKALTDDEIIKVRIDCLLSIVDCWLLIDC